MHGDNCAEETMRNFLKEGRLFAARRLARAGAGKRILFSPKEEWEEGIRWGFRYSRYELRFAPLSKEKLTEYDLVVPLTIEDVKYLSRQREQIPNPLLPVPSLESICLCDDKYLFNTRLIGSGLARHVPRMGEQEKFPYVIKKKVDEWGRNCHIIRDEQEEETHLPLIHDEAYYCQEMVPGRHEYACHILYSGERVVKSLTIDYLFEEELFVKGQDKASRIAAVDHSRYAGVFAEVLEAVGFVGLCCFNYKLVEDEPVIFEVNPRFGGSLANHFCSFIDELLCK